MMTRFVAFTFVLASACRGGPTTVRYAGPPVGECASGRAYQPPPLNAQTQPFIPIAEAPSQTKPETREPPPTSEPAAATPDDTDDETTAENPAKPATSKKHTKKKPKRTKKQKESAP
ncbi:MAG TPA: hypothetical protein VLB44_18045 [Kofleriaceae bacterium]|nr:hypothetical protein [Kofleriaceae bacterium]